jgi:hypothetical protein
MNLQDIIVLLLVVASVVYLIRKFTKKDKSCGGNSCDC